MEKRICSKCNKEKPIDEFLFRNKKKKQYHSACGVCYKKQRKIAYEKNKVYYLTKNKRLKNRNREWLLEHKKNESCYCCGENDIAVLDFHHIKQKTKEVSKMVSNTASIDTIKKEINKCVVLCSNCHRKIHYHNISIEELKCSYSLMEKHLATNQKRCEFESH